jgi:putative hydrolase of the HAD superfamily
VIRLVCFDLGGVIVRHCRSWAEACIAAGLPVHAVVESVEATARRKDLALRHTTGRIGGREFCALVSESVGGAYTPEEVARIHHAWLLGEYAGVGAVLGRLVRARSVRTGVLSNTNELHWDRMGEFPSVGLLENRHASHLIGHAKPGEQIYREFERLTGVAGGEVLFLDDLEENIAAARGVGWTAARIDHTSETAPQIEAVLRGHGVL